MHAYLIMTHNNFYNLEKLLLLLDDPRNDIYIHVDKKVCDFPFEYYRYLVKESMVYFTKRITVTWGTDSQVECEMILMKAALKHGNYEYFHLLSGSDLPLKSQDYIHSFFKLHMGNEFLHTASHKETESELWKIDGYHIPEDSLINHLKKLYYNKIVLRVLKQGRVQRLKGFKICKTANWFSLTGDCVKYILSHEKLIRKISKYTICGDEFFLGTIMCNSNYWGNVYQLDNPCGHMRYIDWEHRVRYSPKTLDISDYDMLISSEMLWARKFDENTDRQIIDAIFQYVKGIND